MSDYVQQNGAKDEYLTGDSWIILTEIEKSIKTKVEAIGTPLSNWDISINYGIKTGFNDAFIISSEKRDEILSSCVSEEERSRTDAIIRPILRGRDIHRYGCEWANLWVIATFPARHYDIDEYPSLKSYLLSVGIEKLEQTGEEHIINGQKVKARKKTNNKWFETQDSISYWDDLSKPKIVWGNLNQTASYAYADGTLFINAPGTMIVPASKYLLGTLNSKLADFYIRSLGVVRNAGYFEYKPMFISKLPVLLSVADSEEESFSKLIDEHDENSIDKRIYELYGLSEEEANYIDNW